MTDPICRECNREPCVCAMTDKAVSESVDYWKQRAERAESRVAKLEADRKGAECQDGRGDPPNDCNWPLCGCDPKANEVLAVLEESGWPTPQDRDALTARLAAAEADARRYRWLREHTAVTGLARFVRRMNKQFLDDAIDADIRVIDAAIAQETKS